MPTATRRDDTHMVNEGVLKILTENVVDQLFGSMDPSAGEATSLFPAGAAQVAQLLLGQNGIQTLVQTNLVLVLERIEMYLQTVDALPLNKKMEMAIAILKEIVLQTKEWDAHIQDLRTPLHDKKKRRQRRKRLAAHTGQHTDKEAEQLARRLLAIIMPNGVASLQLPTAAYILGDTISKAIEQAIPATSKKLATWLFQRSHKISLLYILFSSLRTVPAIQAPPDDLDAFVPDVAEMVPTLASTLIPPLRPYASCLPKTAIAREIVRALGSFLSNFSITQLVQMALQPRPGRQEVELAALCNQISRDKLKVVGYIRKWLPQQQPPADVPHNPTTPLETFMYGLQLSATEMAIHSQLDSFDWQTAISCSLSQIQAFTLSHYADQAALKAAYIITTP